MKKFWKSALITGLVMSLASPALALNYTSHVGNDATFETLGEARVSMVEAVPAFAGAGTYVSAPTLDACSQDGVYVYRSADMFGSIRAAARMNTVIYVFTDSKPADKTAAEALLVELGLTDIINECGGSVLLVTPINGTEFTAEDAEAFRALQDAVINIKGAGTVDDVRVTYADAEYFGGLGFQYAIGLNGGATFINQCIASDVSLGGRLAGVALIGGEAAANVACPIPAYVAGADASAYEAANAADDLANVITSTETDAKAAISAAYYGLLTKSARSNPTGGAVPYVLVPRSAILNGVTPEGIHVIYRTDERFADIKTVTDEYLQSWYECVPEEVLNNTAAPGSIPLILCMYGMGDDPLMFVENNGYLNLAARERIALVAPEHQDIFWCATPEGFVDGVELTVMPMLVRYMLETYPALDSSRVYVTGYSMGGWATNKAAHAEPSLFAAACPMSGITLEPTEEQNAMYATVDMPTFISTSTLDLGICYDNTVGHLGSNHERQIQIYAEHNEMPVAAADYEAYPEIGVKSDAQVDINLTGGFANHRWYLNNNEGTPMMCISITEGLVHSLFPDFANLMWDFASQYSRDVETGAVIYTPAE